MHFMAIHILLLLALLPLQAAAGVIVTVKPLHSLVVGVMGDTGQTTLLLDNNASPHDFHLKPSQMKAMQKADIIFYIDNDLETFLAHAFETLPPSVRKAAVVQKAELIVLPLREGGGWDTHDHGAHEHGADTHGHEAHEHETTQEHHKDRHREHAHEDHPHRPERLDLHVWLDPENARRITRFISRELGAVYPGNRKIYEANADRLIARLDALDRELKIRLSGLRNRPFIVFHDAYQYFERAYGLNNAGSITFMPDEPPSPKRLQAIRKRLKETEAACVFREPQFSDRLVVTVVEGTNTRSSVLDPLGAELAADKDLYFSLLRNLAKNLEQCLTGRKLIRYRELLMDVQNTLLQRAPDSALQRP